MVQPRHINPNLSARTERGILWAMSLHPDERPQSIEEFRQALFGNLNPITQPRQLLPRPILADLFTSDPERILAFISVGLLMLSLVITIFR
jgi:hypothetical protein